MSRQVDERVVSMQFDNKQFESNVKTSMSTLDKLKAKLNLKGAAKSLDDVNSAAKKINMNGLANGVETVSAKFSALQVMGVTALANITNSAVNAGKRIVSALTIDPVKTGFQEYETQINAVQTIMANTQKEMEGLSEAEQVKKVNGYLEELNKYADQTIYNFTEMTRNIGTFTAAGVDLATSTNAIKGIANLAAVSGSTSQQASTAMYQLSQALSSGTVKLMDWNSVVNAGMGGQVFQDALKETARVHGIAIDEMIETQGSFRETLQEGWLTSEILTDTLQKFTLTTEGLTDSQVEANREMLRAKGYTEEQIEGIFQLGKTATDAATKVKTFTQLFDVLKEAAQSGWAQTWKIIVGDFQEAKSLFTPLANFLTDFINKMSDARNNFLKAVLYPWETIQKKLDTSAFGKIKDNIEEASKALSYYQEMMHSIWMGDWKNSDTGRYGLLDNAGHDHRVLQDLVNLSDEHFYQQGWKYKLTMEDVNGVLQKYGYQALTVTENVEDMTTVLSELTDEQLRNLGLTEEEITLFRMLAAEAKRTGTSVWDLINRMSGVSGKTHLLEGLKNLGDILVGTFKAVGEAWDGIFDPPSIVRAYTALESFNNFTEKLRLTDKETGELNDNGKKLMRTLKGVFAVVDIITTILGGGFKIAFKVVTTLLGMFNLNILDFTAIVGDALVRFRDWLDGLFDFEGIAKALAPHVVNLGNGIKKAFAKAKEYIVPAAQAMKDWFLAVKDSHIIPFFAKMWNGIKNTFGKVVDVFRPAIDGVKNWINSLKTSDNLAYDIVVGIANGLVSGAKLIGKAINIIATDGLSGLRNLLGMDAEGSGSNIISGLVRGIKDGAKIVWDAMVDLANGIMEKFNLPLRIESPSKVFIAIGGFIVSGLLIGLTQAFPDVWTTIKEFGQKCAEAIGGIDVGALVALVTMLGSLFVANKFGTALVKFAEPFDEFGEAIERVSKGAKNYLNAKAFSEVAKAIAILVACIVVLTLVDQTKMWSAVIVVGIMAVLFAGLIGLLAFVSSKQVDLKSALNFGQVAILLVGIAASIAIIAYAMAKIASIKQEDFERAAWTIGGIAAVLTAMLLLSYISKGTNLSLLSLVGVAAALWIIVKTIEPLAALDEAGQERFKSGVKLLWYVVGLVSVLMLVAGVCNAFGKNGLKHFGGAMVGIAVSMGILAFVAYKISQIEDKEAFEQGILYMMLFSAFVIVLMGIAGICNAFGNGGLKHFSGTMISIAVAIGLLALIAYAISLIKDKDAFDKGVGYLWSFVGMISVLMIVAKLCAGADGKKIGKSILSVSIAIAILAGIAVLLSLIKNKEALEQGIEYLWWIGALVGVLAAIAGYAKNTKFGFIITITAAIVALAAVAVALSLIKDQESLRQGVVSLTILVGAMIALTLIMAFMKNPADWKTTLKTLGPILLVIAGLALVLRILKDIDGKNAIGQAIALSVLLAVLAGAVLLLSNFPVKFTQVFEAAAAMVVLAAALALISPVLRLFGSMSWTEIIKGLAAVAGVFVVFGLAGLLLKPVAGVIVALAAAVLMFGAGVTLLGVGILTAATGILILANALKVGGDELVTFISDLIGLLPELFASIGSAIGSFAQSIIMAAPLIGAALKVMVLTAIDVLITCVPAIVEGVFKLVIELLNKLLEYLPQVVPLLVQLFVTLLNLVTENLPTILDAVVNFLVALLTGIAERIGALIQPVVDLLVAIVQGVADIIGPVFDAVIEPVLTLLKDLLVGLFEAIGPYLPDIIAAFKDFAKVVCDAIVKIVEILAPYIPEITALLDTIVNAFVSLMQEISPIIDSIAGLVEKLGNALTDIIYAVSDTIDSIGSLITDTLQGIADVISAIGETIEGALGGISDVFDSAFGGIADIIDSVGDTIEKWLDGIADIIEAVGTAALNCGTGFEKLANGIKTIVKLDLADLVASLSAVVTGVGDIAAHASGLANAGDGMKKIADGTQTSASGFSKMSVGLANVEKKLLSLPSTATESVSGVTSALDTLSTELTSMATTISLKTTIVSAAISFIGATCVNTINGFESELYEAGKHLIDGLAGGIRANKPAATSAALDVADSVESIIRGAWQVNSPSKLFYEIALGVGEGMENAFGDSISGVKKSADDLANSAVGGFSDTVNMIAEAINSDINAEPTIRPVFDLTDLKSGAATINSMLDGNRTLSVNTSAVGSLSASMAKLQNGNNSQELLSAIKGLRKDVANNPRNTYSIGGVSFNEGSDVAEAMETIVRAIIVEGRT